MLLGVIGGALTFGFAGSFVAFLLLRIPMGLSRGGSEPVNVALVSEWWPKEHRGFAVGVHHNGFPFGQFLAGVLIALVLGVSGWAEAFLVIPLIGIPIIIAQIFVGTKRHQIGVYRWIDEHQLTRPTQELSIRSESAFWAPVREALRHTNVRWSVVLIFLFLWAEAGAVTFLTVQFVGLGMSLGEAALLIDSVPRAAGTAMGIMIGIALGVSGLFASVVAGWIIDSWGFTWHYLALGLVCLLCFVPLARIKETVQTGVDLREKRPH